LCEIPVVKEADIMWFWWFMFICDLLIPLLMIICGRMLWKNPPKSINGIIGYRTPRSMKNMDTWNFAHDYCGRLWWKMGWIMLIPSIMVQLPFYNSADNTIGMVGGILCTVQCVILIVSIVPTETALRRNFTDEGTRR
jgi:uncharacterized membrane protein